MTDTPAELMASTASIMASTAEIMANTATIMTNTARMMASTEELMASTAAKYITLLSGGVTATGYLMSLGAVVLYDGTLDGAVLKNWGTGGSALNGTLSNVTIANNDMTFNGTTSNIKTPNSLSFAALTDFEYVIVGTPSSSVGAGAARLWNYSNVSVFGTYARSNTSSRCIVAYSTTASDVSTNAGFGTADTLQALFFSHSIATKLTTMYKGIGGAVTEATYAGTPTAGVGTLTAQAADLYWGNRLAVDSGYGGTMRYIAIIPRALTPAERTALVAIANL